MTILNLGCGTKTSSHEWVINYDWSLYLRIRKNPLLSRLTPLFLRGVRRERFSQLPSNIVCHNLSKGIPHADGSVDVVYHSHLFEHLDRPVGLAFLKEVWRVLKPGGIQRVVVPDLELLARDYLGHLEQCETDASLASGHDEKVAAMIEQCVRREGSGAASQKPWLRFLDNLIAGDARSRGETHQWMYDRINLKCALQVAGFTGVVRQTYNTSLISQWNDIGLDLNEVGEIYKKESLYMEAIK